MIRIFNSLAKSIGEAWCKLMHPDPMWPVSGEYQCRVCQRRFPVAWEKSTEVHDAAAGLTAKRKPLASAAVTQEG